MTIKTTSIAHKFAVNDVELGAALPTVPIDQVKFETKGRVEARGIGADQVVPMRGNRFLRTIMLSYNQHYPLVLAPDHIWLMIAQGFSHHVNENVETLRDRFVEHAGKELIEIDVPPGKGDPFYPWVDAAKHPFGEKSVLDTFVDEIEARVKGEIVNTLMPTFSTTTIHSRAAMAVTTMSTFKGYFEYGMQTLCGIPEVTLLGEAADWEAMAGCARQLAEGDYDLDWWTKYLLPVLDKIVESAKGNPDPKFWEQIIQVGGGSGGPHISGWINTLLPYLASPKGGRRRNRYLDWEGGSSWSGNNPSDYEVSVCQVPVYWNYNGIRYEMEFEAGIIGASQDPVTKAIQPEIGWAVSDVTNVAKI